MAPTIVGVEPRSRGDLRAAMARIVQKFGGTSVADIERIRNAAQPRQARGRCRQRGRRRGLGDGRRDQPARRLDATDEPRCTMRANTTPSSPSGEQVTAGLMALALQDLGVNARSWLGWQMPIRTDGVHGKARIEAIETAELERAACRGPGRRGRRVPGHRPRRPHHHPGPRRVGHLGGGAGGGAEGRPLRYLHRCRRGLHDRPAHRCEGAGSSIKSPTRRCWRWPRRARKVLQTRSVEMAMNHRVRLQVLSSFTRRAGHARRRRGRDRGKASGQRHRL